MLRKSDDGKIRVLSLSYGKDSIATIRVCEILGYPLDRIVTADVWATQDIPADLPPMWEFKKKADEIIFDRWGIRVEHLCAMQRERAKSRRERLSYNDYFYGERQKGKRSGQTIGFPLQRKPWCNKLKTEKIDILGYILSTAYPKEQDGYAGGVLQEARTTFGFPMRQGQWCTGKLKARVLDKNIRFPDYSRELVQQQPQTGGSTVSLAREQGWDGAGNSSHPSFSNSPQSRRADKNSVIQYLGIAADEPLRIARHIVKPNIVLPLVDIGWDEALCGLEAKYMGLLSPTYETGTRDGCWFCHNQGVNQLRNLRHNYPDLWALLMKWDLDSPVTFHADGHTVHDFDRRFEAEDRGDILPDERFQWDMLEYPQTRLF